MARLVMRLEDGKTQEFELKPGKNRFGRAEDNDFKIEDISVSNHHCEVEFAEGQVQVRDLGSTNGTYINSAPVLEAPLYPGEILTLGTVNLTYQREAGAPRVARQAPRVITPPIASPLTGPLTKARPGAQTGVIAKLAQWRKWLDKDKK